MKERPMRHPTPTTIRDLRQRHALTLADLATLANVAPQTVWRAERGVVMPSARVRRALAVALHCAPGDIAWPARLEVPHDADVR
jgi:transcriptional regulator with XRE-family HTH domain